MHRLLGLLLVAALTATSVLGPLLHTHAYHGHVHDEHQHGPAAHAHDILPATPPAGARFEECDPGQHVVDATFVCSHPPATHASPGAVAASLLLEPSRQVHSPMRHADVRAHGPPGASPVSPRPPPATTAA